MTSMTISRFWDKVDKTIDGCWEWTASLTKTGGYGQFHYQGKTVRAHRFAWEQENGPIPEGLVIDHLCRNRKCVNPSHMETVTIGENVRRGETYPVQASRNLTKTECPHGHPYNESNTYVSPRGTRGCRKCRNHASEKSRKNRRNSNVND